MAGTISAPISRVQKWATVSDLLARLGGVPSSRVRMTPPPGTATEKDLLDVFRKENRACELVDCVLVEKPMSNTKAEMKRKVREYFKSGTRLVWVVDPKTRSTVIHRSPRSRRAITEDDYLDGGSVLPGFRVKLGQVFEDAEP